MSGVLLTAGYDRSPHSIAVAEGLRRLGCSPDLILIAYPMTAARVRTIVRSRGASAIMRYLSGKEGFSTGSSPLKSYLADKEITERSLRAWAKRWNVRCVAVGDVNAARALGYVKILDPTVTAYTGGGILRRAFLDAAGRCVLNAHSGPLPEIRGMNACEWSLLLGQPLSVTIHLIDEGIDTGAPIERISVKPETGDTLSALRERCTVAGIDGMVKHVQRVMEGRRYAEPVPKGVRQRQCFVLAPALREMLLARLPVLIEEQQRLPEWS